MNSAGAVQWSKLYGHDSIGSVEGYDILQMSDSGFMLIGNKSIYDSATFLNTWHSYLVRTNSNGDTLWTKSIIAGSNSDYFYKAAMVSSTEFVVTGTTLNSPNVTFPYGVDITLQKFNINGDLLWSRLYGDTSEDNSYSVIHTSDGGFAIVGYTFGSCYGCVYLIKTDSLGCVVPGCQYTGIEETQYTNDDFKIFPNPSSSILHIQSVNTPVADLKIHIYDALGRNEEYSISKISSSGNELSLNVKESLNGFYFLKIENKKTGKYCVKKVIVIH